MTQDRAPIAAAPRPHQLVATLAAEPADKVDLCVFIGRFQPFTLAHASVVTRAFEHAVAVLVLIGSSGAPPSHRNPFSYDQRVSMIFDSMGLPPMNLYCVGLEDSRYNDIQWVLDVQRAVEHTLDDIAATSDLSPAQRHAMRVSLIGYGADRSAYYLNRFPGYAAIAAPYYPGGNAAAIREAYFSDQCQSWLASGAAAAAAPPEGLADRPANPAAAVPPPVHRFLTRFAASPTYRQIREEYDFIQHYRAQWTNTPYPVIMLTVDAMVIQNGHILLVRRKQRPGLGLWALPGGYLPPDKTLLDGMLAALVRETRIGLPLAELQSAVVSQRAFDARHRDPRGRVITHAFRLDLPTRSDRRLWPIRRGHFRAPADCPDAAGEATEAVKWWPLAMLRSSMLFVDHFDIIKVLGGWH